MTTATIELPPKLVDVFDGEARYRGAYGGRGSGKTRSFALMTAVRGYMWGMSGAEGQILCARQFMNSLDESSLEEVKAAIRSIDWLDAYYEIGEKFIRSKDGRIRYTFAGLSRNIDSIKSKARVLLAWVDEAEGVIDEAWKKLTPTVREDDSEIWVTWNPERKGSATDVRFRQNSPHDSKIVELNWSDNPFFPEVLEAERQNDKLLRPDEYDHVWEGHYRSAFKGAYYASYLQTADKENRIGPINADPLMEIRAFWDIGGTSARSDATSIWVGQFVGAQCRVLNYYEAVGQPLSAHANWLKDQGYAKAVCVLPHDGVKHESVYKTNYQSSLNEAGFSTIIVPNQGAGAAMQRVEAGRRAFPQMWFDTKTEAGRDALAWYHEKHDEARNIGFGPEHDWASHAADSFGLMALAYLKNTETGWTKPLRRGFKGVV